MPGLRKSQVMILAIASRQGGSSGQRIDRALQDEGGSGAVDALRSFCPADVGGEDPRGVLGRGGAWAAGLHAARLARTARAAAATTERMPPAYNVRPGRAGPRPVRRPVRWPHAVPSGCATAPPAHRPADASR